jgi:ACS family hexuronate transporter-like MFS transporter
LLFFITTLNYTDRQVLGVLAPQLQRVTGWNEIQYGNIVTAFTAAYALGMLLAGRFIDRAGTWIGYTVAIAVWSLATIGHSLARTVVAFAAARFALGLAESANFLVRSRTSPSGSPNVSVPWLPVFQSGREYGRDAGPYSGALDCGSFGWPWAFVFWGALSAVWIVPWLAVYRRPEAHTKVSAD